MSSTEQPTTNTTQDVGFDKQPTTTPNDPFATQREGAIPTFENGNMAASKENKQAEVSDHTQGPEWDASKTPPSRFQQRKGSIYATPGSRDGHVDKNADRDVGFHEKVKEMVGKGKKDRRASKGSDS